MTYLVDTNVLLRLAHPGSLFCPQAIAAVRALHRRGDVMAITSQNAIEFWSVATRRIEANGLDMAPTLADRALRRFEGIFQLVPDVPAVYQEWRELVVSCRVSGRQVHDARIAAVMLAHGITHLLTFNTADFDRYPGVIAVHPRDVVTSP